MNKSYMYALGAFLAVTTTGKGSQSLALAENKRLYAAISATSMNRLAVPNDRISQIFGDDGAFVMQSDELTGQVFIKPSSENGTKPLALTLITENGVTQDLTLDPKEQSPTTIILKGLTKEGIQKGEVVFDKTLSLQENVFSLIKKAILGQLSLIELPKNPSRSFPEGTFWEYVQSYQAGSVFIHVFRVDTGEEPFEEKLFYEPGDIALSFTSNTLFVISRI